MTQTAAEKLRSRRPMPDLSNRGLAREGQPAVSVGRQRQRRSEARPCSINSPITPRHMQLLERMTMRLRAERGRSWRQNDTVEMAIDALARELRIDTAASGY